jgi:hypothetical protein
MKKLIKFTKSLDLGKEDIADLTGKDLSVVKGGQKQPPTNPADCLTQAQSCNVSECNCTYSCICGNSHGVSFCTCYCPPSLTC